MENTTLSAKDLEIGYNGSKNKNLICKDINFTLYESEVVCLLGRNGVGKSTLLKTIANMIPLLDGNLAIHNVDYSDTNTKDFSKKLAIVLTESLPESSLTVFETIALGRQPYTNWIGNITSKDYNIILNAMELTATLDLKNKLIHQLSDGQLQRVMIARALAQDTPIILLDEPTSHLDLHHKINIFKLLEKISSETKKTILISTHEINLALKHTHKIMLIHQHEFNIGYFNEQSLQEKLIETFNSDEVKYDKNSNQFIF